MLGVRKVVWLPGNAEETETDGHVDGIAVFAAPGRVLVEADDDPDDPSRATKAANNEALAASTDASGRRFEVIRLPEAPPDARAGRRYCRSYVNGYICNGAVIVPAYDAPTDPLAREVYEAAFPGRRIVPVDVRAIAVGGGGIHCITQQEV